MEAEIFEKQRQAAEDYLRKISSLEVQEMNFVLPYEMSKKFRSLMLIETDLKFIKEAANQLILSEKNNAANKTILACIWQAIATTYGKICTKSQSGFTSIEESWFKDVSSHIAAHKDLMLWRNKFIAHREDSEHEKSMAFFKIRKHRNLPEQKTYQIKAMAKVMPTIDEMRSFMMLFDYLLKEISLKIDKEASRVMGKFYEQGREFSLQHLVDEKHNRLYDL